MRAFRLAVLSITAVALGSVAFAQSRLWTQPPIPTRAALDRLHLDLGWKVSVPLTGPRDGIATIQSIGGQVIVQTHAGRILCIDGESGSVRWNTTVGEPNNVTYELGFNDNLLAVSNVTRIFGLDRANGALRWTLDLPTTPTSPPAVSPVSVFVNLSSGRLASYVLPDAQQYLESRVAGRANPATNITAATQSRGAGGTDPRAGALSGGAGGRSVTVSSVIDNRTATTAIQAAGGRAPVGGVDIKRAFQRLADANAPLLFWDVETTKRVYERPVVGTRTVLDVADSTIVMVDRLDKTRVVELKMNTPVVAPVGQYGNFAYVAGSGGELCAVDLDRQTLVWRYIANGSINAMPQATDDDLYVVADRGGLIRLDRQSGSMIWQNPEAARFMAMNPKYVYAADRHGQMVVLDRRHGTLVARLDVSGFVVPVQNETTDRILLAAHDGTIISLHDKSYAHSLQLQSEGAKVGVPVIDSPKAQPKPEKPLPGRAPEPGKKPAEPGDAAKPPAPNGKDGK